MINDGICTTGTNPSTTTDYHHVGATISTTRRVHRKPQMAALGRVMMVLAMTMCAPMDLLIPYTPAHATTITSGMYSSNDDTIPSGGTTLEVAAMLADAVSKGQTEAVCTFTRPTFDGTLTITLPNTTAAWTTTNIPLRLLIQDGTSGATIIPTTFVSVTGVLALGSSITIAGGNYTFTDQFLQLPSGITIQDGSSLTIEGGTYHLTSPSASGGKTTLLAVQNIVGLHLKNGSYLAISNNTMLVSNVSVNGTWQIHTIHTLTNSPITVDTKSAISISHNSMVASNVSVSRGWQVHLIYTSTSSSITISTNSTLAISRNNIVVFNVSVGWSWGACAIYTSSSYVTVDTSSSLAISNNTMDLTNMSVSSSWQVYTIYSPITVNTNSSLAISNNSMAVSNVSVGGDLQVYTIFSSSPIVVNTSSTLAISRNNIIVSNVNVGWGWELYTIYTYSSITVNTNSSLAISNNSIVVSNVSVSWSWLVYIICSPITVSISSIFAISKNSMSASNVSVGDISKIIVTGVNEMTVDGLLEVAGNDMERGTYTGGSIAYRAQMADITKLRGSGIIRFAENNASLSSTINLVGPTIPTFTACRNYANGIPCVLYEGGVYSCATGTNLTGRIAVCDLPTTSITSTTTTSPQSSNDCQLRGAAGFASTVGCVVVSIVLATLTFF